MFSFGKKIAGKLEEGSRFGQKMLGSVARFGTKAASTIQSVKKGIADVPVIGAVADIPIYKGVSANQVVLVDLVIHQVLLELLVKGLLLVKI